MIVFIPGLGLDADFTLSSRISKNISLPVPASRPNEGRLAIVTNAGRDAVDAAAPARADTAGRFSVSGHSTPRRTALSGPVKPCGPDASTLASSFAEAGRPDRARTRSQSAR
jgi:hypothetical protein